MRLGRANVVEVAFGKQPNISMKQPIPVVLLFENAISAPVPAEDFSLIIFASFLLYRPKRQVFSSVSRSHVCFFRLSQNNTIEQTSKALLSKRKEPDKDEGIPRIKSRQRVFRTTARTTLRGVRLDEDTVAALILPDDRFAPRASLHDSASAGSFPRIDPAALWRQLSGR